MTDMPDRIWAEEPEIFDGMGFWQEQQSAGLVQYMRLSRILSLMDAHPNASPGWLALQIREGRL